MSVGLLFARCNGVSTEKKENDLRKKCKTIDLAITVVNYNNVTWKNSYSSNRISFTVAETLKCNKQ